MAALYQGDNAGAVVIVDEVVRKGENWVEVRPSSVRRERLCGAFEAASRARSEALFVMMTAITKHRRQISTSPRSALCPSFDLPDFAESGGLLAMGEPERRLSARAAYVDCSSRRGGK